jgi:predicted MFS family arabinose efflux permease
MRNWPNVLIIGVASPDTPWPWPCGKQASIRSCTRQIVPITRVFALLGAGSLNYGTPQKHRLLRLAPAGGTTLVSSNSSAIYIGIGLAAALGALTLQAGPVANCLTGAGIAVVTMLVVGPVSLLRPRARLQEAYPTGGSVV